MPTSVIIVLGNAAVSRALPSFSVIEIMPVSAMAEVRAGDADVGLEIFLPHHAPGDHREVFGFVGRRVVEFFLEGLPDLAARQVHRGKDEVIRRLLRAVAR